MTPFMFAVRDLLDGTGAPEYRTEPSHPVPVAEATHTQVEVRSLAEQLVSEANAVLREHGDAISLVDDSGQGELAFTLGYRNSFARVRTSLSGRTAVAELVTGDRDDGEHRQLGNEDELQALVLNLLAVPSPEVPA